jgi:hypothetical protein
MATRQQHKKARNFWPFRPKEKGEDLSFWLTQAYEAGERLGDEQAFNSWRKGSGIPVVVSLKAIKEKFSKGVKASRRGRATPGPVTHATGKYKGYKIWYNGDNYWHTDLEPETSFESEREVKRFIDWQRKQGNPKGKLARKLGKGAASAAELATPATYARIAGETVGGVLDATRKLFNPTDRAYRYRANATPPPGPRICAMCGSRTDIMVGRARGRRNPNTWNTLLMPSQTIEDAIRRALPSASVIWRYPDGRYMALAAISRPSDGSLKVAVREGGIWSNRTIQTEKRTSKKRRNPNDLPVWLVEVLKDPADGRRWKVWAVEPIPGPDGWIYVHGEFPTRASAEAGVMDAVSAALRDRKGKFGVEFHTKKEKSRT